jgi:serine protease DegS
VANPFGSLRSKLWIAAACLVVLLVGYMTIPAPAPTAVAPPQERAAPLLEAEVERRQQLRIFEEIQQLGPRLARHSVTIPGEPPLPPFPSDLTPPSPRPEPDGHGLIISADGEVLTSAGALRGRESLEVELFDGRRVQARVVAFDPDADLVLLQSDAIPRTDAAPWATTPPSAGMLAVAVSHAGRQVAVAPAFVMAAPDADRRVRTTSTSLLPGTPLFTTAGEVFAVAAGADDPTASLVAPAVSRLRDRIASGQARRGALGLTFQPLDAALRRVTAADGVLVADVAQAGPAAAAGVLPGDVIISIAGNHVNSPESARDAIAAITPQAAVSLQLSRDGKPLTIEVMSTSALGLRVRYAPRKPDDRAPEARAVFDAELREQLGVLPETRILTVDGNRVDSADDVRSALRRERGPVLFYVEDERGRFFRALERPR